MKFRPVTKLDKGNKMLEKVEDDVMSGNCDIIVIYPIYCQFGAIQKVDSGLLVCKS